MPRRELAGRAAGERVIIRLARSMLRRPSVRARIWYATTPPAIDHLSISSSTLRGDRELGTHYRAASDRPLVNSSSAHAFCFSFSFSFFDKDTQKSPSELIYLKNPTYVREFVTMPLAIHLSSIPRPRTYFVLS